MDIFSTLPPLVSGPTHKARALVRTVTPQGMALQPEKTDEEFQLQSSPFSFQRQLSPEEENRVLFLKNMLAQLLTMANGNPTEEQKARIRDIEKEIEKITGVKVRSNISTATSKMPGKKKDEEDEETSETMKGISPNEAMHARQPEGNRPENPGMQMVRNNTMHYQLRSLFDSSSEILLSAAQTS